MGKIIYILTILYIGLIPMEAITIAEDISYGRIVFILLFAVAAATVVFVILTIMNISGI